ncbi:hypothetical protein AKJ16_DCAP11184 [Drosera capensis]
MKAGTQFSLIFPIEVVQDEDFAAVIASIVPGVQSSVSAVPGVHSDPCESVFKTLKEENDEEATSDPCPPLETFR